MLSNLLLALALVSPLAAQPIAQPPSAADKDFCGYLKDVEAKADADCASDALAALKSSDPAAYSQKLDLAEKRKTDVLKAYDILKVPPAAGKQASLPRLVPPINERTFPARLGPESKAVYARWLQAENQRLRQEKNGPIPLERKKEIDAAAAANRARIAALGKLKDPSALSCALGEYCGTRPSLADAAGPGEAPGRGAWTAADYARANAQPDGPRLSGGGLDRAVPALGAIASEAVGNTPFAPLAEKRPKSGSPHRTAAELALATAGGLLLFGGLGGKFLGGKIPGIRRDMGIAAGVCGVVAVGAVSLAALAPAAPVVSSAAPIAETAAVGSAGTLTPALAGGATSAAVGAQAQITFAEAIGRTVLIGGVVYNLEKLGEHLKPLISPRLGQNSEGASSSRSGQGIRKDPNSPTSPLPVPLPLPIPIGSKTDPKDCSIKAGDDVLSRFIDGTRLAPGFLSRHEGMNLGHTIEKHVKKTPQQLRERLKSGEAEDASTFFDQASAENLIREAVNAHKSEITEWFESASLASYAARYAGSHLTPIGNAVTHQNPDLLLPRYDIVARLKRTPRCQIYVLTAYPE